MTAMVVVSSRESAETVRRVAIDKVHSIVSHRTTDQDEQYLVRWTCDDSHAQTPPLSWHSIRELSRCLELIQDYLDTRDETKRASAQFKALTKKRKLPDAGLDHYRQPSPLDRQLIQESRTTSASRSPSVASSVVVPVSGTTDVYNGVLEITEEGFVLCRPESDPSICKIDIKMVPTAEMIETACHSSTESAVSRIRFQYMRNLERVPSRRINLVNTFDTSTPSLRFRYIPEYVLMEGIHRMDPATQQGCLKCSPHMGRDIGCEYTKKCDCLEYAAVDENRLDAEQKLAYKEAIKNGWSTMGFPKKFPYFAEGTKVHRSGCLVPFYLESRRAIYECNDRCHCGPYCRNKNVQFGRTVEVEIFKTVSGRGWGLRCREDLYKGQFIDTYRGEIITNAEADRREEGSKAKASYLYSLDKFQETEGLRDEDIYVVDGEFMGGPTKFINHSCEPNCRQYTVSYNKNDPLIYDIAFFACRDIPAGEELTFDYLDKDEDDEPMASPGEDAIPCLCGATKCRKWLWT